MSSLILQMTLNKGNCIDLLSKYHNTPVAHLIWPAGDQCGSCLSRNWFHDLYVIRLDNIRTDNLVSVGSGQCANLELITDFKVVQITEKFPIDVVMRGKYEIAPQLSGHGPVLQLPNTLTECFPGGLSRNWL